MLADATPTSRAPVEARRRRGEKKRAKARWADLTSSSRQRTERLLPGRLLSPPVLVPPQRVEEFNRRSIKSSGLMEGFGVSGQSGSIEPCGLGPSTLEDRSRCPRRSIEAVSHTEGNTRLSINPSIHPSIKQQAFGSGGRIDAAARGLVGFFLHSEEAEAAGSKQASSRMIPLNHQFFSGKPASKPACGQCTPHSIALSIQLTTPSPKPRRHRHLADGALHGREPGRHGD